MKYIKKTQVMHGVYLIYIQEAELSLLCACPADVIKHLIKKGYARKDTIDGVPYETGPNAILLSDVSIQNGELSNLTEFPILHMLYNQGMLIKNHPNFGKKPLLIGRPERVISQLSYIMRGNYGLFNKEELERLVTKKQLDLMMKTKLGFAFGKIRTSHELIDTIDLGSRKTHIKNGVYLKRKSPNVFELSYKDESVALDLNLKPNERYMPSFPPHFHSIDRTYFSVVYSGSGDGWDYDRPSMGAVLIVQGNVYLIDAGPYITEVLNYLGIGLSEISAIFHTHAHDDHFAGIASLIRSGKRMRYYATQPVRESVIKKLSCLVDMPEKDFYDYFDVAQLEYDTWQHIDGFDVKANFSPHPVETTILKFRTLTQDGYKIYAHLADVVSTKTLEEIAKEQKISARDVKKIQDDYLEYADLKMIDIGGGLIHGQANDFINDTSKEIVLAHVSRELNFSEKQIGSNPTFGVQKELAVCEQDFYRRTAFKYLSNYFPSVDNSQVRILLNSPMVNLSPQSILVKQDEKIPYVYMVLTGNVEVITKNEKSLILSSGTLIGELLAIANHPPLHTYRAISHVRVLKINALTYKEFVDRNSLAKDIASSQHNIEIFSQANFFASSIPYQLQRKIAKEMEFWFLSTQEYVKKKYGEYIYCVQKGLVEIRHNDTIISEAGAGEFFGEEMLFSDKTEFSYYAKKDTTIFVIPNSLLVNIPIIRWKMYEEYKRRQLHKEKNASK